jgi:hypothetical protein
MIPGRFLYQNPQNISSVVRRQWPKLSLRASKEALARGSARMVIRLELHPMSSQAQLIQGDYPWSSGVIASSSGVRHLTRMPTFAKGDMGTGIMRKRGVSAMGVRPIVLLQIKITRF